uniref:Uncharacterized protein n=1 Tax=Arundo donax TaxID=35708 RepID=A0A0A9EFH1_ARUDO
MCLKASRLFFLMTNLYQFEGPWYCYSCNLLFFWVKGATVITISLIGDCDIFPSLLELSHAYYYVLLTGTVYSCKMQVEAKALIICRHAFIYPRITVWL